MQIIHSPRNIVTGYSFYPHEGAYNITRVVVALKIKLQITIGSIENEVSKFFYSPKAKQPTRFK